MSITCPECGKDDVLRQLNASQAPGIVEGASSESRDHPAMPTFPLVKPSAPSSAWGWLLVSVLGLAGLYLAFLGLTNSIAQSVVFGAVLFSGAIAVAVLGRRGEAEKQKRYRQAVQKWDDARAVWDRLYYCARDQNVFDPLTRRSVPANQFNELLYPAEPSTDEPVKTNRKAWVAGLFSLALLGGAGQIYLGQIRKGLVLMALTLFTFPFGLVIPVISAIDAYLLTQRLNQGQTLGEWEFFWAKPLTTHAPFWTWFWMNTLTLNMSLLLGTLCYAMAGFLFYTNPMTVEGSRNASLVGGPIGAIIASVIIGFIQHQYLRRHFVLPYWIPLTMLGGVLGGICASIILVLLPLGFAAGPVSFGILGAGLGVMQWLALRPHVFRSGFWVLANTIAGAVLGGLATVSIGIPSMFADASGLMSLVAVFVLVGGVLIACAVASAITGMTLIWLLRFQKPAG